MTYQDLPKFVCDDIHFNGREIRGYDLPFNLIYSEREAGKSTFMYKTIWDYFRDTGNASILVRRRSADITEQFITDIGTVYEKFTGERPAFKYKLSSMKDGMLDIYLCGQIFIRVHSLSVPVARQKSLILRNVQYLFYDEFCVNTLYKERYLPGEMMALFELRKTYMREAPDKKNGEKKFYVYCLANPYSYYTPFTSEFQVDINLLKPGVLIHGDVWAVQCYQICDELKEKILKSDPLFRMNSTYTDYAMKGIAINDTRFRIIRNQPKSFQLRYCFKLHGKVLGIFSGIDLDSNIFYWTKILDKDSISKRRDIVCYDFGDMIPNRTILDENGRKNYSKLRGCIRYQQVAHFSAEEAAILEEIFQLM